MVVIVANEWSCGYHWNFQYGAHFYILLLLWWYGYKNDDAKWGWHIVQGLQQLKIEGIITHYLILFTPIYDSWYYFYFNMFLRMLCMDSGGVYNNSLSLLSKGDKSYKKICVCCQ